MKKISFIVLTFVLIAMCFPVFASAYGDFEIIDYDVEIFVHENNTMDITEDITVNFSEEKHGIIRDIPTEGFQARTIDGEYVENKFKVKIKKIDVAGHEYDVTNYFDSVEIKIGDPDIYVDGEVKYHIQYHMDVGDDGIEQFDDFYFDVIGQGWDVNISDADISIHMPKPFDTSKMEYYSGYTDSNDIYFEPTINGNTINIHIESTLLPYYGFTVRCELPEGYYVDERMPLDLRPISYIVSAFLALLALFLFFKNGRDEKLYPIISFSAPKGITPADIGYIIDGTVDSKDVTSLIIYWAHLGFIEIEETGKRTMTFKKLKKAGTPMKKYERYMFDKLFEDGDTVTTKELTNSFYSTTSNVKTKIKQQFNGETDLFTKKSKQTQAWLFFMLPLPVIMAVVFHYVFMQEMGSLFISILDIIVLEAAFIPLNRLINRWHVSKFAGKTFKIIFIIFILLVGFFLCISAFIKNFSLGLIASTASYIIGFCACFGKKRSDYARDMMQQILGFKEFIMTAEKDKINELVMQNPKYFYSVLPYAYVMGITEKWAKKFDTINVQPPSWYNTPNSYHYNTFSPMMFGRTMDQTMTRTQHSMTSAPSSSSSSGGFSGSSGGFSGGGVGGGGGSSW